MKNMHFLCYLFIFIKTKSENEIKIRILTLIFKNLIIIIIKNLTDLK